MNRKSFSIQFGVVFSALILAFLSPITTAALEKDSPQDSQVEPYVFVLRSGEKVDAERGTFSVQENRGNKLANRSIKLRYVRFPATTDTPGPPIVYLAGGPGGSGTDAARGSRFRMFQALRGLGDVIAFDQRGTGMSNQLPRSIQSWQIPRDQPATREAVSLAIKSSLKQAIVKWKAEGVDLNAYNSRESAYDIEDLRRVLKVDQIRLCGISYGTHLSLAYMRYFPSSVHSVVLAGVEGPDHTVKLPADQQRLLVRIQKWIDAQPKVQAAYPDFLGSIARVLNRLEKSPVVVKRASGKIRLVVTQFDIQRLAAAFLRGPENFTILPMLFKQMDEGDFSRIPVYVSRLHQGRFFAMGLAMDAASGRSEQRAVLIQDQAMNCLLGDAINFPYEVCRQILQVDDLGEEFRSQLHSDIPMLAISGTADGRTPVGNAEEVLSTITNSAHLIIDGAGHSDPLFLSSPQIVDEIVRFFSGEKLRDSRIELEPIDFRLK